LFFNKLCQNSNKIPNQKKEKKTKKMHLQANGFKGFKKTFANNGGLRYQKIIKKSLTFLSHFIMRFKGLRSIKGLNFNLAHKQTKQKIKHIKIH